MPSSLALLAGVSRLPSWCSPTRSTPPRLDGAEVAAQRTDGHPPDGGAREEPTPDPCRLVRAEEAGVAPEAPRRTGPRCGFQQEGSGEFCPLGSLILTWVVRDPPAPHLSVSQMPLRKKESGQRLRNAYIYIYIAPAPFSTCEAPPKWEVSLGNTLHSPKSWASVDGDDHEIFSKQVVNSTSPVKDLSLTGRGHTKALVEEVKHRILKGQN